MKPSISKFCSELNNSWFGDTRPRTKDEYWWSLSYKTTNPDLCFQDSIEIVGMRFSGIMDFVKYQWDIPVLQPLSKNSHHGLPLTSVRFFSLSSKLSWQVIERNIKNHTRKGRVITICWVNASQRLAQILREHPTAKELVCVCERAHTTIAPPKRPPLGKSGPSAKYLLRHAC